MLTISREAVERVMSLKGKITDPRRKAECIADVVNMIETKESILARAEWGSCCGDICRLVPRMESELQVLRAVLRLLREGSGEAASLLEDYIALMQEGYRPEPEHR